MGLCDLERMSVDQTEGLNYTLYIQTDVVFAEIEIIK